MNPFDTTGPSKIKIHPTTRPQRFFVGLQDPINYKGISIPPKEQAQRDADKQGALKRGSAI